MAESDDQIGVLGLSDHTNLIGFAGDASWTGYALISGHWYQGAHQVDVNTAFLTGTGLKVGGSDTISSGSRHITVQIAGEIFDPAGGDPEIVGRQSTLATLDPGLSPDQYDVALTPGTSAQAYADALGAGLGQPYQVNANGSNSSQFFVIIGLIAMLTLLLTAVAALGVLNTVVLQTRERVHDLGVFKAVGMTPRQTIAMVVCSVAGIGLVAGLIAIPAGIALHNYVLPVMGHAAQATCRPRCSTPTTRGRSSCWPWPAWSSPWPGRSARRAGRPGPAPRSRCAPSKTAQRMQVSAAGRAASRSSPIGCPHRSHSPYRPSRTRSSAAPIAASWSLARSSSAAVCCRSKASVAPSGSCSSSVPPALAASASCANSRSSAATRRRAPARSASSSSRGSPILPTLTAGLTSAAVRLPAGCGRDVTRGLPGPGFQQREQPGHDGHRRSLGGRAAGLASRCRYCAISARITSASRPSRRGSGRGPG